MRTAILDATKLLNSCYPFYCRNASIAVQEVKLFTWAFVGFVDETVHSDAEPLLAARERLPTNLYVRI